jgi:hypothetical protein
MVLVVADALGAAGAGRAAEVAVFRSRVSISCFDLVFRDLSPG